MQQVDSDGDGFLEMDEATGQDIKKIELAFCDLDATKRPKPSKREVDAMDFLECGGSDLARRVENAQRWLDRGRNRVRQALDNLAERIDAAADSFYAKGVVPLHSKPVGFAVECPGQQLVLLGQCRALHHPLLQRHPFASTHP